MLTSIEFGGHLDPPLATMALVRYTVKSARRKIGVLNGCGARWLSTLLFQLLLKISDEVPSVGLILDARKHHFVAGHERRRVFQILEEIVLRNTTPFAPASVFASE
jgi:hypothetical protein